MKNSNRIVTVKQSTFNVYLISSIISGIADISIFALLSMVILNGKNPLNTLISTVVARVSSSIINFAFNYKIVFKRGSKKSIIKYYALWLMQLGASYGIATLFGNLLGGNLVVVKALGDILLGVISYQVQYLWVFKENSNVNFFGPLVIFCRSVLRIFSKRYACKISTDKSEPVVYVCRHLNMRGPFTTIKWLPFDVHPMVLNVFFDKKTGTQHFKDYTFSKKKGKNAKEFSLKASISGWFMARLTKSLKAIPVYRGHANPLPTFKKAMEYLTENQSVIVYPDIEYDKNYDTVSDIYDGFLYLGIAYKRKTGKDLKFVPLYIDDSNGLIIERQSIIVNKKEEIPTIKEQIIKEINKKMLD